MASIRKRLRRIRLLQGAPVASPAPQVIREEPVKEEPKKEKAAKPSKKATSKKASKKIAKKAD